MKKQFGILYLVLSFSFLSLSAQNTSIIVANMHATKVYCFRNYLEIDSLYRLQTNGRRLTDPTIVLANITMDSMDSISNGSFLRCFTPANRILLSNNHVGMTIHVILNEMAKLQAAGVSFHNKHNPDLIVLNETELACMIDFIETLQFEYERKPDETFLYQIFYTIPLRNVRYTP